MGHLVRKITDLRNHRRFILRCLGAGISPVTVSLKNTIRTSRSFDIIGKVKRQMLNEMVRSFNNTINLSSCQRDTCVSQKVFWLGILYQAFINRVGRARHKCILEGQLARFIRLWHKTMGSCSKDGSGKDGRYMYTNSSGLSNHIPSNINITNSIPSTPTTTTNLPSTAAPDQTKAKGVKNLSSRLLTIAQVSLFARGTNFAFVPLYSAKEEYITE